MGVMFPQGGDFGACQNGDGYLMICATRLGKLLPSLSRTDLELVAARLERINSKVVPYGETVREDGNVRAAQWVEGIRKGVDLNHSWVSAEFEAKLSNAKSFDDFATLAQRKSTWPEKWDAARYLLANKSSMLH